MKSGTKYVLLNVDKKGRLHMPSHLRKEIGVSSHLIAEKKGNKLILTPMEAIKDPIEFLSSLSIRTKKTPVQMKREAEEIFGGKK